jgi:predicted nucleic-acid-binding protein
MIGRDTNVLLRYNMQDDPEQSPKATELIGSLTSDIPRSITMVSARSCIGC